jgi:hypothetical protein
MLRKALQHMLPIFFGLATLVVIISGAYISTKKSLTFPSEQEIDAIENVAKILSPGEKAAVIRSRASAVRIVSADLTDGGISSMSGTYITYNGQYFILTASHGVYSACRFTQIIVGDEIHECKEYVFRDKQSDYIIIRIDEIVERTPIRIPQDIPRRNEWITELATQNKTYYTGFPNNGGPYTFEGKIVAYSESEAIFIDSYGWSGSSGAGVFSADGNLIGWVMALEVGETYFGRQVLENFMWVIPLFKIDWPAANTFMD